MFLKTRLATGAIAGVLTLAIAGGAAAAAFTPVEATANVAAERGKGNDKVVATLTAVLARLVAAGTLTADQQAKILEAVQTAVRPNGQHLKRIWNAAMRLVNEYLGLDKDAVNAALREGATLGQLADATGGKSRQGLIDHVVAGLTTLAATAVTDGHVTQAQADEFTAALPARVTELVDHVYVNKEKRERAKERAEKLKELNRQFKERREELRETWKQRLDELKQTWKDKRAALKQGI